jgi:hypothetical protein
MRLLREILNHPIVIARVGAFVLLVLGLTVLGQL